MSLLTCLFHDYLIIPFPNGLSDHDAQILAFKTYPGQSPGTKFVRKVDQQTISDFTLTLSNESWSDIFNTDDVNLMYNSFLNTYLRIFYAYFPLTRVTNQNKCNRWITVRIQTCKRKRELFLLNRSLNNPVLKRYYKKYCNVLVKVIQEAKRMTFSTRISKSYNKTRTTWNIINELLGKQHSLNDVQQLIVEGTHFTNQQLIAKEFNKYFSSIVDTINSNNPVTPSINTSAPYMYLQQVKGNHYSPMVFKSFSTKEIISIINSLKTKTLLDMMR